MNQSAVILSALTNAGGVASFSWSANTLGEQGHYLGVLIENQGFARFRRHVDPASGPVSITAALFFPQTLTIGIYFDNPQHQQPFTPWNLGGQISLFRKNGQG